jgi:hypothetical protein
LTETYAQGKLGGALDGNAVVVKVDTLIDIPILLEAWAAYPTFKTGYVNDQGNLVITNQFINYGSPAELQPKCARRTELCPSRNKIDSQITR